MAGETVLIVDDTPVNLKLTRILLLNEGYKVLTAASAEEALELLRSVRPQLILADIQLPGIDGLEMTRRIKQNPATREITVVALTAFAMKGDEQKAIEAGCDGYITKPIDTRTLGRRLQQHLDIRAEVQEPTSAAAPEELTASDLNVLRRRFLDEGQERARQLLLDLDGAFHATAASRAMHQWVGTGGLLGYSAISRLAREVEGLLNERPLDTAQVRESLTNLILAFSSPREARDHPIPDSIVKALSGKIVAVVGLPAHESHRLCVALERVEARPIFFELSAPPDLAAIDSCALAVIWIRPETAGSAWLAPAEALARLPKVFVGERDHLLGLEPAVQKLASEFLMDSWQPDEALVRLSLAISHSSDVHPAPSAPLTGVARVLIADDDSAVLALVRTALENYNMRCEQASDGPAAIEAVRTLRPDAVILDINMPGMDGYEVLAAIRAENLPARVLLLSARQTESDVIRAFSLGADDYVVKPFSPLELVARLKRLLVR